METDMVLIETLNAWRQARKQIARAVEVLERLKVADRTRSFSIDHERMAQQDLAAARKSADFHQSKLIRQMDAINGLEDL